MKIIKLSIILIVLFNTINSFSQSSPKFYFDSTNIQKADFCGYNASNFVNPLARIANNSVMSPLAMPKSSYPANAIFDCGAFRLYYEDIALSTGDGFDDSVNGATSRATLCAVYQYIQNTFNFTNIPANDPITIEIERSFTSANPPANTGVLATAGPVYPNSTTPGIYNGSLLNHVLTNASPNVNLFDARMQVNFIPQNPTTNEFISYHLSTTLPVANCNIDLFTVLLHEVGHQMGFGSLLTENSLLQPISAFGNNQFTLYDWQNIWHGNINTVTSFEKIVTGSLVNPQINPLITNSSNYLRDESLWLNDNGRFQGNLPIYSGVYGNSISSLAIGSIVSHICGDYLSFLERFSVSPGYRKSFSMSPSIDGGEVRREYTDEEIRIFLNLGYSLNPIFANSTTINGLTPNSNIILTNRAPITTKQVTSNLTNPTFPDLVQTADFTISNNGVPLLIQLSSDPTISDADGDVVRVENNSLFNIRGCSSNGNNHGCITTNALGDIITFTPRPNFIGRAQFGFYLNDGNERGSFMVYTIDVLPGSAFINTPNINTPIGNNELIVNGDFEELSEIKIAGNALDENLLNTSHQFRREEGLYFSGVHFSDAHPLQYINWQWTSGGGELIRNSQKNCNTPISPYRFGANPFSFPNGIWNPPVSTIGNGYSYITGNHNYHTLASPLLTCHRYIAHFDINFQNTGLAIGSTYTLNLNFHSAISYPTNPSLQSVPVSITVGTGWQTITVPFIYCSNTPPNFLNFVSGGFTFYDNVSLIEDLSPAPPLLVNATANSSQICIGNSSTLTGIATNNFCNTTYVWQPSNLNGASVSVSPTSTTIYTLTVNDGCRTSTTSVNVVVNPLPTITAIASPTSVCASSPNSVLTASGATTYSWSTGATTNPITVSPTNTTVYTVTGTDANGCSNSANVTVTYTTCTPCQSCPNLLASGGTLSSNPTPNTVYCLTNDLEINGNVTISGCEIKMASGVSILIPQGSSLTLEGCHLYANGDMWKGISCEDGILNIIPYIVGGIVQKTTLIEDAMQAVNFTGIDNLTIINATFNRNYKGVNFSDNTTSLTAYPYQIENSLFTCRDIPFICNSLSWPLTSSIKAANNPTATPLATPYINNRSYSQTNANAFLKAPFAGQKSNTALRIRNVGLTANEFTTPTYGEAVIGTTGLPNYNVFDNHYFCMEVINSNVKVVNSIFQNTIIGGADGNTGGLGISAKIINLMEAAPPLYCRLQVVGANANGLFANKFYNCSRAIKVDNYFEYAIKNNDFRSTQTNAQFTSTTDLPGKLGIYIKSNAYRLATVQNNKFYNIANAVTFNGYYGKLVYGGTVDYSAQYIGQVTVFNNTIAPHLPGNSVTTQYVNNAITLANVNYPGNLVVAPGTSLSISNNKINGAYRGIATSNWAKKDVAVQSNSISLVQVVNNTNALQYGISATNNTPDISNVCSINSNTITGYGIVNNKQHGIYTTMCLGQLINCNTTTNTYNGLLFDNINSGTFTSYNTMSVHHYGFVLDNFGVIGQQGTPTAPCDNVYNGSWTGNFKTATLNGSSAQNSPMYVRQTGFNANPDGSGFTGSGFYGTDDYFYSTNPASTILYVSGNPTFLGCNQAPLSSTQQVIAQQTLEKVVLDQITGQNNNISKHQVYRLLKANPDLKTGSVILTDFYNASQTNNREQFVAIEGDLSEGSVTQSANKVAAISVQDNLDANYKAFYEVLLKHTTNGVLSPADSLSLMGLANSCPFTEGAVVYQARALYNIAYSEVIIFENNCPVTSASSRLAKKQNETNSAIENAFDVLVYPNPGNGSIFIAPIGNNANNLNVIISDISGRVVYSKDLNIINGAESLDLNIVSGTYIVKITNAHTNEKVIKKLIIQK